jgi:hypothetical protein
MEYVTVLVVRIVDTHLQDQVVGQFVNPELYFSHWETGNENISISIY